MLVKYYTVWTNAYQILNSLNKCLSNIIQFELMLIKYYTVWTNACQMQYKVS